VSRDFGPIGICTGVEGVVGRAGVISVFGGLGVGNLKPCSLRLCNTADMVMLLVVLVSVPRSGQSSFPLEDVGAGEGGGESWREEEEGTEERGWPRDDWPCLCREETR
jgi:hypothetical protein